MNVNGVIMTESDYVIMSDNDVTMSDDAIMRNDDVIKDDVIMTASDDAIMSDDFCFIVFIYSFFFCNIV